MVTRADACKERCQYALDLGAPEHSCAPGNCQYLRRDIDFAAALKTAQRIKGFSNLGRAYVELVRRAQAGQQALAGVNVMDFSGALKSFAGEPWLVRVRDAANDLEPVTHLKVKRHG